MRPLSNRYHEMIRRLRRRHPSLAEHLIRRVRNQSTRVLSLQELEETVWTILYREHPKIFYRLTGSNLAPRRPSTLINCFDLLEHKGIRLRHELTGGNFTSQV